MKKTPHVRCVVAVSVATCFISWAAATSIAVADLRKPSDGTALRVALTACHKLAGDGQLLCYEPGLDRKTVLELRESTGFSVAFFDFSDKRRSVVPVVSVTDKDLALGNAQGETPPATRTSVTFNGRWLRVVMAACSQLALGNHMLCEEPTTDDYSISVTPTLFQYDVAFSSGANDFHVTLSRAAFLPTNLTALGPTAKAP